MIWFNMEAAPKSDIKSVNKSGIRFYKTDYIRLILLLKDGDAFMDGT